MKYRQKVDKEVMSELEKDNIRLVLQQIFKNGSCTIEYEEMKRWCELFDGQHEEWMYQKWWNWIIEENKKTIVKGSNDKLMRINNRLKIKKIETQKNKRYSVKDMKEWNDFNGSQQEVLLRLNDALDQVIDNDKIDNELIKDVIKEQLRRHKN